MEDKLLAQIRIVGFWLVLHFQFAHPILGFQKNILKWCNKLVAVWNMYSSNSSRTQSPISFSNYGPGSLPSPATHRYNNKLIFNDQYIILKSINPFITSDIVKTVWIIFRHGCMSAAAKRYKYLRRLFKCHQMDFEFAAWQMVYLFISPQKVYRNFQYRKRKLSIMSIRWKYTRRLHQC